MIRAADGHHPIAPAIEHAARWIVVSLAAAVVIGIALVAVESRYRPSPGTVRIARLGGRAVAVALLGALLGLAAARGGSLPHYVSHQWRVFKARQKLMVARSKGSAPPAADRAPDFRLTRVGFQHLRDHGNAKGVGNQTITAALPGRRDRIDNLIAEGDHVWMRFKVAGTQGGKLYGLPPTGKRIEVPEIGVMRFTDGKWKEAWYFADELGLMLQLNALHMLEV